MKDCREVKSAKGKSFQSGGLLSKISTFLSSDAFMVLVFFAGLSVIFLNQEILGTVLFVALIASVLLFSRDLLCILPPLLILLSFAIRCKITARQNTLEIFMGYIWIIPFLILALILHFYLRRKEFELKRRSLFYPALFVSAAVCLGGVGIISAKEYFSPTALFYTFALGFGALIIYLLFGGLIGKGKGSIENPELYLSKCMVLVSVFLFFAVIQWYIEYFTQFSEHPGILHFQWRNNACTVLMTALPFCFYLSSKNFYYMPTIFLSYAAILLSGSRGGLLLGGLELLLLCVYYLLKDKRHRGFVLFIFGLLLILAAALLPELIKLFSYTIERMHTENGIRLGLLQRAAEDFRANPLTGRGLGYMGNRDIHKSAPGTLCWYHSSVPQVLASFGLLGAAAYLYQLRSRIVMLLSKKSHFAMTVLFSFAGLELMSLVNPGIFAPPYLILMTIFFVIAENSSLKDSYPSFPQPEPKELY